VLDSYGISGKAKDPAGLPRRLKNLAPWKASEATEKHVFFIILLKVKI
jgi:hypothetical protein